MRTIITLLLLVSLNTGLAQVISPETSSIPHLRIEKEEPRIWSGNFTSVALGREMRFLVVLPEGMSREDPAKPVIYFLHGLGRNERTLLENQTTRSRVLASKAVVVLPRALRGWYINSPVATEDRFADYVDEVIRLVEHHFPASRSPVQRAIGGWSMGGYGAMYTATRRPDDFKAVASIIGILDFPRMPISEAGQNYNVPPCFGTTKEFWDSVNPRLRLPTLKGMRLFVAYAEGAAERQMNQAFLADAERLHFHVEVKRLSGGHTFPMVEQSLAPAFSFLEEAIFAETKPR